MLLSRSGPTDLCPHSCLPSGDVPFGNSCGAGSQCFASPTGAALANAAPDISRCQVELLSGSRSFALPSLTAGSRLSVPFTQRRLGTVRVLDPLDQHVDAVGAPEQLIIEYHGRHAEHAEHFGFINDAIVLGARIAVHIGFVVG